MSAPSTPSLQPPARQAPLIPPLPLLVLRTPIDQAAAVLVQKQAVAQQLISTALQVGGS